MSFSRFSLFLFLLCSSVVFAQIPRTVNYQGVLLDAQNQPVTDSTYLVKFSLFTSSANGTELWSEDKLVTTSGGVFDVILGTRAPLSLSFDAPYWLEIQVENRAPFTPRIGLTSVPYALRADTTTVALEVSSNAKVVRSINAISGNVRLKAGSGVQITELGDTITISTTAVGSANPIIRSPQGTLVVSGKDT
ncbi:MAG: hypothetical protein JNJ85_12235, partial [Candidatus Kapabacteria bacterium]|nr:hypothetical protein [Candidatus Kapabacteria bacterium]